MPVDDPELRGLLELPEPGKPLKLPGAPQAAQAAQAGGKDPELEQLLSGPPGGQGSPAGGPAREPGALPYYSIPPATGEGILSAIMLPIHALNWVGETIQREATASPFMTSVGNFVNQGAGVPAGFPIAASAIDWEAEARRQGKPVPEIPLKHQRPLRLPEGVSPSQGAAEALFQDVQDPWAKAAGEAIGGVLLGAGGDPTMVLGGLGAIKVLGRAGKVASALDKAFLAASLPGMGVSGAAAIADTYKKAKEQGWSPETFKSALQAALLTAMTAVGAHATRKAFKGGPAGAPPEAPAGALPEVPEVPGAPPTEVPPVTSAAETIAAPEVRPPEPPVPDVVPQAGTTSFTVPEAPPAAAAAAPPPAAGQGVRYWHSDQAESVQLGLVPPSAQAAAGESAHLPPGTLATTPTETLRSHLENFQQQLFFGSRPFTREGIEARMDARAELIRRGEQHLPDRALATTSDARAIMEQLGYSRNAINSFSPREVSRILDYYGIRMETAQTAAARTRNLQAGEWAGFARNVMDSVLHRMERAGPQRVQRTSLGVEYVRNQGTQAASALVRGSDGSPLAAAYLDDQGVVAAMSAPQRVAGDRRSSTAAGMATLQLLHGLSEIGARVPPTTEWSPFTAALLHDIADDLGLDVHELPGRSFSDLLGAAQATGNGQRVTRALQYLQRRQARPGPAAGAPSTREGVEGAAGRAREAGGSAGGEPGGEPGGGGAEGPAGAGAVEGAAGGGPAGGHGGLGPPPPTEGGAGPGVEGEGAPHPRLAPRRGPAEPAGAPPATPPLEARAEAAPGEGAAGGPPREPASGGPPGLPAGPAAGGPGEASAPLGSAGPRTEGALALAEEGPPGGPPRGPGEPGLPGGAAPSPADLTSPQLREPIHREVTEIAGRVMAEQGITHDPSRLISDELVEHLNAGRVPLGPLHAALQARGMSLRDFTGQLFRPAIADAGRRLQALSVLVRRLERFARDNPALQQAADELAEQGSVLDEYAAGQSIWRRLDNLRRAMLVSQISTTMRNVLTQTARAAMLMPEQALDAAVVHAMKGLGMKLSPEALARHPMDGFRAFGDMLLSLGGRYGQTREFVDTVLSVHPERFRERLFNVWASDVSGRMREEGLVPAAADKVFLKAERGAELLNVLNRSQEFFFRRNIFRSTLLADLHARGVRNHPRLIEHVQAVDRYVALLKERGQEVPRDLLAQQAQAHADLTAAIPEASLQKAVHAALEMTFAQNPRYGTAGYAFLQAINRIPGATLVLPFPRFLVNSLRFYFDYSPLGFLKLAAGGLSEGAKAAGEATVKATTGKDVKLWGHSREIQKLAAGDPSTLSKALLGSTMFLIAYQMRSSDQAGERWYEYKVPQGVPKIGGRTVDMRPYNPFAAYLFAADLVKRAREDRLANLDKADIAAGALSTNLRAGTGLALLDAVFKQATSVGSREDVQRLFDGFAGQYVAGWLTPFQVLTDVAAEFDEGAQIRKERRLSPFTAPVASRFGFAGGGRDLPEYESPTRAGPERTEFPLLKQLTGLLVDDPQNPLERELARLDFTSREVYTGTRSPEVDLVVKRHMGELAESVIIPQLETPEYRKLPDAEKGFFIANLLRRVRKIARGRARAEVPEAFAALRRRPLRQRILEESRADQANELGGEFGEEEGPAGGPPLSPFSASPSPSSSPGALGPPPAQPDYNF